MDNWTLRIVGGGGVGRAPSVHETPSRNRRFNGAIQKRFALRYSSANSPNSRLSI
jgi:hypothetical protein